MTHKILKFSTVILLFLFIGAGCKKEEKPIREITKIEDYYGVYSGDLTRERLGPDGHVAMGNAVVEQIPTNIEITPSSKGDDFLVVHISSYDDSILCEFNKSTGHLLIKDDEYSFNSRTDEFPELDGNSYAVISTMGSLGYWQDVDSITLGFSFLKDINDSIYICETSTRKIN